MCLAALGYHCQLTGVYLQGILKFQGKHRRLLNTMETISSRGLTVLVLYYTVFLSRTSEFCRAGVLVSYCDNRQVPGENQCVTGNEDGGI